MRKYINADSIKIKKTVVTKLKAHCKQCGLSAYHMFIYFDDGVYVGFSSDKEKHIKLEDTSWMPRAEC